MPGPLLSIDRRSSLHRLAISGTRRTIAVAAALIVGTTVCASALADRLSGTPAPAMIWRVVGEGRGLPAMDTSTVFFLGKRHEVVAIDRVTGVVRWRQRTHGPGETTVGASVVVAGAVVAAGDQTIVGFDRVTGSFRWRFDLPDGSATGPYLGRAVRDVLFTGSSAGRMYAIAAASGAAVWSASVADNTTVFGPIPDDDLVIAGYTTFKAPRVGGLVAVDVGTGRERWRTAFAGDEHRRRDSGWAGGPVFVDQLVFAASADGVIHGFDTKTGSRQWTLPPVESRVAREYGAEGDFRPLARSGRRLLAGSLTGQLMAFDLATRREIWRYSSPANGAIAFRLASDDRTVYVPFVDGCLAAVDVSNGRERWRTCLGGAF
jgi:outer membrane protein assembly factor BamB